VWTNARPVYAEDTIQIQVGEKRYISSNSDVFFAVDDTIVDITRHDEGNLTLVGLRAGSTQIAFTNNGVYEHVDVTVTATPSAIVQLLNPQFKGRSPYFLYQFTSNSSFTDSQFYQSPNYTQTLNMFSPFFRGKMVGSTAYIFGDNTQRGFTSGQIDFQFQHVDLLLGPLDSTLGRLPGAVLSAIPAYGTRLRLQNIFVRRNNMSEALNIFGGVQPPSYLKDLSSQTKKYGFNYELYRRVPNSIYQDLLNIGYARFQIPGQLKYNYNAVAELSYHITKFIQLGGGFYKGDGGFGVVANPIYQSSSFLINGQYQYIKHGLTKADGTTYPNTLQNQTLTFQKLLKDKVTTLSAGVSYAGSYNQGGSAIPSSASYTGNLGIIRQYAFSRRYGLNYSGNKNSSSGTDLISNAFSMFWSHPVSRKAYFQQNVGYTNTKGSSTSHQSQLQSLLQYDSARTRQRITWDMNITSTNNITISQVLTGTSEFFFRALSMQFGGTYTKGDVDDNVHQLQGSASILYQPSSTTTLSLKASSSALIADAGVVNSGSFTMNLQKYLGPGVVPDSILKRVFTHQAKQTIGGRVFRDENYNGTYQEGDFPLANTPLYLDETQKVVSGPDGVFTFYHVKPGQHTIKVMPNEPQGIVKPFLYSFIISDGGSRDFAIPVTIPKATVSVHTIIDVNNNGQNDDLDEAGPEVTLILSDPNGLKRKIQAASGGGYFNGVDYGRVDVQIDPLSMSEGMEVIGGLKQSVDVTEYKEYPITFLFKPYRSLRGLVSTTNGTRITRGLLVTLGDVKSSVDREGYYWLRDLPEGEFVLNIQNLRAGYCIIGGAKSIKIGTPYSQVINIQIGTSCQ
jgi:hypothetical protein